MGKKKKKKTRRDTVEIARSVVEQAIGEPLTAQGTETHQEIASSEMSRGRKGGLKGGRARANKLTANERSEIARKAAKARWATKHQSP